MMNNGGFDLWYQVRRFADLDPVQIDGWAFRLHYWVTSTGIFAASAVAFAKQYFGDPIECIFVSIINKGEKMAGVGMAHCGTSHASNSSLKIERKEKVIQAQIKLSSP